MSKEFKLETERLICRPWHQDDLEPFAKMCADPEVMRYFPNTLTPTETERLIEKAVRKTKEDGFCFGPVVTKAKNEFLGFVGLNVPEYGKPLPFDPCVEIGWRLKRSAWGYGYASEAARSWLQYGFEKLGLEEIISFTVPDNQPSQNVMLRLGMRRDLEADFLHPALDPHHRMARHVLYRLSKTDWLAGLE